MRHYRAAVSSMIATVLFGCGGVDGVRQKLTKSSGSDPGKNDQSSDDPAANGDAAAPMISAFEIKDVTGTTATVIWTTDKPATGAVTFGLTATLDQASETVTDLETSHTIPLAELTPNVTYHVQATSKDAAGNIASSDVMTFISTPGANPAVTPVEGLWLSAAEIQALPTAGAAWDKMKAAADGAWGTPMLSDGSTNHDTSTLAGALVYARLKDDAYKAKVVESLNAIVGTETDPAGAATGQTPVLALARNLVPYVIAAELVGFDDAAWKAWLGELRVKEVSPSQGRSLTGCQEQRPNNFGTHCASARMAVDIFLDDKDDLAQSIRLFRGWLGDRSAATGYTEFNFGDDLSWQADENAPVGVNPKGATKDGHNIDGPQPEEMGRGASFQWPPVFTDYAWGGLQGAVVAAELLHRRGYDAYEWQDRAVLRAVEFLYRIDWPAVSDDEWQVWIINKRYGLKLAADEKASAGKNMGWTAWTHP